MRLVVSVAAALGLLAAATPAARAAETLYIAPRLAIAPDASITHGLENCPFPQQFSETLAHNFPRDGVVVTDQPLPTPSGRSLKVEVRDVISAGNGFIGHRQFVDLRGTLYQDGRKVASFTDRAQFQDSGLETACHSIRMSMKAEAWYVARWVKHPVDGQELKHFGE